MSTNTKMLALENILQQAENAIERHSFNSLVSGSRLTKESLDALIMQLYADGVWWVSGLRYMHARARNERFKKALADNIACETGTSGGTAHMVLLDNFVDSIGLRIDMKNPIYKKKKN